MKVAFLKGKGIYDRIIQAGTWGPYSHCEFVFSDNLWFGNRPFGNFKTCFHTVYTDLSNWDLVTLPAFYNSEEPAVYELAKRLNDHDYDWKGIFLSQVLPLGMQADDKYFCSEVVMFLLHESGMFRGESRLQSPNGVRRLLRKAGV